MDSIDVLVVGEDARTNMLCLKLAESPLLRKLYCFRGNAGTAQVAENIVLRTDRKDTFEDQVVKLAAALGVGLVVVGPEDPLINGVADKLLTVGIPTFGPRAKAAFKTEGSKVESDRLARRRGVPRPKAWVARSMADVERCLAENGNQPVVVKPDKPTGGKGVTVPKTVEEVWAAAFACLEEGAFNNAGRVVLLEELLEGPEVSVFVFTDGRRVSRPFSARDRKLRFAEREKREHNPNTGGMRAIAPAPFWNLGLEEEIMETIMRPMVAELLWQDAMYRGVLYAGIILTPEGPKVLEFNCRFGDPEAQAILPLLKSDLLEVMLACAQGNLHKMQVEWDYERWCIAINLVDEAYPGQPQNGGRITGLEAEQEGTFVLHYGTTLLECADGRKSYRLNGSGRRISVGGIGGTREEAILRATYRVAGETPIEFPGLVWRQDVEIEEEGLPGELLERYSYVA